MQLWQGKNLLPILFGLFLTAHADQTEHDWIPETPDTVYERRPIRAQNMDYDFENNMFLAHSGWINDREVHYYKFRMYTEEEYPGLINAVNSTVDDVPIQRVYIVTTTGTMFGAVGRPIINHHSAEGNAYSDFMEIFLVTAPANYDIEFNEYRSEGDVLKSGQPVTSTGIIVNMPVVPLESKLQMPGQSTSLRAPIDPVVVWYRGVEVWTYVFEVTDQQAATFFANTRTSDDPDFAITVSNFAETLFGRVRAIPIWHLNQYTNGVSAEDGNAGGPSPDGMRNIISLDRPDAGYSPLWQVHWVSEVPMDFAADDVSHRDDLTAANGFAVTPVNMWINCPNVGSVGTTDNPNKKDSFLTVVTTAKPETLIAGAPVSTIMESGVGVSFFTEKGVRLGNTQTTDMGAYQLKIQSGAIPPGTITINVNVRGTTVRQLGSRDYIATPPLTVYEQEASTVQNMDYDKANNLFLAHSTWYNDRETHTYKFRMYTAETYPGVINAGDTGAQVPIQKLYVVTVAGLMGSIGKPILEFHHTDGNSYSDFMEIIFVPAPDGYIEDSYRSVGDIVDSGAQTLASGIIVNAPLVPNGSGLQDPARKGTRQLPIQPLTVWYKGVEVWTYLFETTDALTANYYGWTREDPNDATYRITLTQLGNVQTGLKTTPMWFLNQYRRGISAESSNAGGPDPLGMRNIISVDRTDLDYSPLRQVNWVTKLPMNYLADEISNSADIVLEQGFDAVESPVFINAPGIGLTRQLTNPNRKTTSFRTYVDFQDTSTWILGSDASLIFKEDVPVQFLTVSGATIGEVRTNVMGGYEFLLNTIAIPPSSQRSIAVNVDGTTTRNILIDDGTDGSSSWRVTAALGSLLSGALMFLL